MRITVSGKGYTAAMESSNVPREEAWPSPTWHKVGRGAQAVYEGDAALAEAIASHLECVGESFVQIGDEYTRAEGRVCLRDAARIRGQEPKRPRALSKGTP